MTMARATGLSDGNGFALSAEDADEMRRVLDSHLSKGRDAAWIAGAVGMPLEFVRGYGFCSAGIERVEPLPQPAPRAVCACSGRVSDIESRRRSVGDMYLSGVSQKDIAEDLGLSRGVVASDVVLLRRRGVLPRSNVRSDRRSRMDRVADLYGRGLTYAQIGEMVGATLKVVSNDVQDLRSRGRLPWDADRAAGSVHHFAGPRAERREVVRLHDEEGLAIREICERTGLSATQVRSRLKYQRELDARASC